MDTTSTIQNQFRYFKNKTPSFVPKEDGFITTAGNPTLGSKYGNNYITTPPITIITYTDVKNK